MYAEKNGGRQKSEGRLSLFGEKMREMRKEKNLLLMDVARAAGVSPGFLSLVETGKKAVPDTLVAKIVAGLDLSSQRQAELVEAAALSAREFSIKLDAGACPIDRRIAHALQTGFAKMSDKNKTKILKLLEDN